MAEALVAYGDFNCPFSSLASRRVGELERRGVATFDWRAVEHDRAIPPEGADVSGDLADGLVAELAQVSGLLRAGEADRLRLPIRQVNTALATERYAGTPAASRPALRLAMFAAHWEQAERIDRGPVLDRLGAGGADGSVADEWRAGWQAVAEGMVPVLILPDGHVSRGLGALAHLAGMLDS